MQKIFLLILFATFLSAIDIINGDVEIFTTKNPQDLTINGTANYWLKAPNDENLSFSIISAGYYQQNNIVVKNGNEKIVYNIKKGNYKSEKILVEQSKAAPNKSVLQRIDDERNEANKIYQTITPLKINTKFIHPLNSTITSPFGSARVFNDVVKSYHSGVDFRASIGTPIIAANDGMIVIAKERYYAGYSVVIDHGEGIYTQYYHLSKIDVKLGDSVKKGEQIGLSGASGRVSGPHLHFGVIVNATQVNPLNFIEKINKLLN
ncbi:M23 family metallopeptidase [Campylobacter majalis]|uniref:M23 family metallopeptidase n=1 Tax=Campylobacter majalis TaxID=2790656 RepID=UPI003D685221